jgi:UDP-glucose:(heptosyl)LPS alpha-1,3-glucosyltransferase
MRADSTNLRFRCQCQPERIFSPESEGISALRIAIIVERFAPGAGGVENVAWQVAHELARTGEDVTVLTRNAEANDAEPETGRVDFALPRVTVQSLRVSRAWQPLRVVAFSRATANAARQGAFDVVHSFSRTRHQDLYRTGGGSHRDYMRRSYSPHGALLRQFSPRHRVLLSMEARVFGDTTQRIQCASRLVADALVADYGVSPERILLLPNAVDSDRYGAPSALEAGRRLRAELDEHDEKAERIWLFPASGWHRKGLPTLLEALAQIRDPGLRLWIAGRDDPRPWLRIASGLAVTDRIRFLGPRDDLEVVYGAVDGMVLPTRYDAFANVTLEAAAAGLPIITTRSNGAAECLEGAVSLVESANDPVALAQAFAPFTDRERRRELGQRARGIARHLDWAQHVSHLRDEYRRIIEARAGRRVR